MWVLEANERTRRIYETAGWRADGTEKSEQVLGIDVRQLRYRRPLGGG